MGALSKMDQCMVGEEATNSESQTPEVQLSLEATVFTSRPHWATMFTQRLRASRPKLPNVRGSGPASRNDTFPIS